jgi:hypothetical protein
MQSSGFCVGLVKKAKQVCVMRCAGFCEYIRYRPLGVVSCVSACLLSPTPFFGAILAAPVRRHDSLERGRQVKPATHSNDL